MLHKIESLRKEPKSVRNRYAFGIALSVTMLVVIVWGISLPSRIENVVQVKEKSKSDEPSLVDQLSELKNFVDDNLEDIKSSAEIIDIETSEIIATSSIIATTTPSTESL